MHHVFVTGQHTGHTDKEDRIVVRPVHHSVECTATPIRQEKGGHPTEKDRQMQIVKASLKRCIMFSIYDTMQQLRSAFRLA